LELIEPVSADEPSSRSEVVSGARTCGTDLDVTVIILTRNQRDEVARSVGFYRALGLPTIVMDGSPCPTPELLDFKGESFELVAHPQHDPEDHGNVRKRILDGLRRCRTNFVLIVGGDDRYVPSGLRSSVEALGSDGSLSLTIGTWLEWTREFGLNRYRARTRVPITVEYVGSDMGARVERYSEDLSTGIFNAVWRTSHARAIFGCAYGASFGKIVAHEYMVYWLALLSGNVVQVDDFTLVRNTDAPSERSPKSWYSRGFAEWLAVEANLTALVSIGVGGIAAVHALIGRSDIDDVQRATHLRAVISKYRQEKINASRNLVGRKALYVQAITDRAGRALRRLSNVKVPRVSDAARKVLVAWERIRLGWMTAEQFATCQIASAGSDLGQDLQLIDEFS
jgi:hypothetical protein